MSQELKVLFIHGLDSGINGAKVDYLKKHFPLTEAPQLEIGMFNTNRNSFLFLGIANISSIFSGKYFETIGRQAISGGVEIIKELCKHKTFDVVVGSSMGGAILIECMRQGVFTNKPSVVLLAPAFKKVYCGSFGSVSEDSIKKSYGEELRRCYDEIAQQKMKRIVIIHGREDQVIPLCDSEELASSINAELMVVEGVEGNHSLNDYLLDGPMPDRAEGQKRFDKLREVVQSVAI